MFIALVSHCIPLSHFYISIMVGTAVENDDLDMSMAQKNENPHNLHLVRR